MPEELTTLADYERASPRAQGFIQYWEGEQPGSELKGLTNPYPEGSPSHREWAEGQLAAVLEAQESDA